jgi:energy-coupling factor transporter ATP-binding protein EcfA2
MGRKRTHRAAQKYIKNIHKKLDTKRNRQKRIKRQRAAFKKSVSERIRHNAEIMKMYEIQPKEGDLTSIVKREINQKFLQRVQEAQTSYDSMLELIDSSQAVIYVLDARDPNACRFLNIEGEVAEKKKGLIFVISKVDLVTQDAAEKWIHVLSKIAPTFAFNLLKTKKNSKLVQEIKKLTKDAEKVAVVGPHGVGKGTLVELLGAEKYEKCMPWKFTICGVDLGMIGAVEWKGRMREFAIDFIERQIINDEIFKALDVMNIKRDPIITEDGEKIERKIDAGSVLSEYGLKQGITKSETGDALAKALMEGKWKWCAVPVIGDEEVQLSAEQKAALAECASPEGFLFVSPDVPIKPDEKALTWIPQIDSDESEDEEEEESGNEEEEN